MHKKQTGKAAPKRARSRKAEPAPRESGESAESGAEDGGAKGRLELTRLDKIFWPVEGYTKGDLLAYYEAVWPWIGPYLRDRPVVLTRYPDGIAGKSFFQHNAPDFAPRWARIVEIDASRNFVCDELRTLLYVVNSGAIPLHVWSSRTEAIERPDWLLLDLDPKDAPFSAVIEIALALHALLSELGTPHFVKTSGQAGMHVLVPLGGHLDHEQAKLLAEVIARVICAEHRDIATIVRPIAGRGSRVYVDYLQNGHGKLMVAPLSVRPRPGAPVSMPLDWSEVTPRLDPTRYTIRTAPKLLAKHGDPLRDVFGAPPDLEAMLHALTERLAREPEAPPAAAAKRQATPPRAAKRQATRKKPAVPRGKAR